jgi:hypothetical protein
MKKTRQHGGGGGGGGIPLRGIRKSNNNKKNKSSVELITSSDKRFRGKVLASVGLDDDDDENDNDDDEDDASYDKCDDIEEATASLRQKHHDNDNTNKRMRKKKNKNKSENSELINDDEEDNNCDDDEDCEEYESFDQSIGRNGASSSHRCSKLKPICNNLLWIIATIAAVIFILYDDEKLEESEIDEDVIQKDQQHQQPYSYNGYKDARIPDDDVAQFGGGILYNNGAPGALPSNSEEDENNFENEMIDQVEINNHHHEPSGIVEVDILWEQLDGYAEMSETLDANDLPVFWHIREYF